MIGAMLSIQSYIIDNFALQAASGLGAASAFRSLAGFGFPLFAGELGIPMLMPTHIDFVHPSL